MWNCATASKLLDALLVVCWRHERRLYAASRWRQATTCACLPLEEWLSSLYDKQLVRFRIWCGTSLYNKWITVYPYIKECTAWNMWYMHQGTSLVACGKCVSAYTFGMTVLPFIASVVDAIKAETVVTKYFWLRAKGDMLQVQKEKGIDTSGTDRREEKQKRPKPLCL